MASTEERKKRIEEADKLLQTGSTPENESDGNTDQPPQEHNEDRTPEQSDSEQLWETKYKTLSGKYNAETKRLNDEVKTLRSRLEAQSQSGDASQYTAKISELEKQINTLNERLQNQPQSSGEGLTESEHYQYLVDEVGETFAQKIMGLINEKGRSSDNGDVQQLRQQVNTMQQQNQQTAAQQKLDTISAILKQQGIDFAQVDNDPQFMDWLNQEEGKSGQPRLNFMRQHFENGDIAKAAEFYSEFKSQERSQLKSNPLDEHLSIDNVNDGDASTNNQDYWTSAEINQFYADKRNGRLSTKDAQRYEQSLNLAIQEGRIKD
jgi:polyhydroxyalkanoate synthesis regulator phasin